jgi:hypothetical protein
MAYACAYLETGTHYGLPEIFLVLHPSGTAAASKTNFKTSRRHPMCEATLVNLSKCRNPADEPRWKMFQTKAAQWHAAWRSRASDSCVAFSMKLPQDLSEGTKLGGNWETKPRFCLSAQMTTSASDGLTRGRLGGKVLNPALLCSS